MNMNHLFEGPDGPPSATPDESSEISEAIEDAIPDPAEAPVDAPTMTAAGRPGRTGFLRDHRPSFPAAPSP